MLPLRARLFIVHSTGMVLYGTIPVAAGTVAFILKTMYVEATE